MQIVEFCLSQRWHVAMLHFGRCFYEQLRQEIVTGDIPAPRGGHTATLVWSLRTWIHCHQRTWIFPSNWQVGSDIFVVGGANSQARFACFAWRVDSFSLWKSNLQTSFGDVYRLDLLRKRWTLLQHPRWPGLIVRWPRKTLKPFTTLGCWLLLVSVFGHKLHPGFLCDVFLPVFRKVMAWECQTEPVTQLRQTQENWKDQSLIPYRRLE